mgnify:CR=1 FL=1
MRTATLIAVVVACALGTAVAEEAPPGIAWYGTWERGLRVAKARGRPILLTSAAPQCHGISGLW